MTIRSLTWILSLALHGSLALFFTLPDGNAALEEGTGEDMFVTEKGITLEGFAHTGEDSTTVEAVEAPPVLSEARPEIEEVKPIEEEQDKVVTSEDGPEQEELVREQEPEVIEQPKPPQVATLEQTQVAVEEKKAAGAKQSGGTTTAVSAYRGKIFARLSRKKVNPRSRKTGTVIVSFTVAANGELMSHEVKTSSGSKVLDKAAVASIERASPFPPMPQGMTNDPMTLTVPFRFRVK
jgi:periplasmic protein TonB